jgi:transcriptional regulator with XRE-family HTH domain
MDFTYPFAFVLAAVIGLALSFVLADMLNVSRQTINALETGRYNPRLPVAFAIAKLFRSRIEDIFVPD